MEHCRCPIFIFDDSLIQFFFCLQSPPDRERLITDIEQNITLTTRFRYTVSRKTHSKEVPGILSEEKSRVIKPDDPVRSDLLKLLNNNGSTLNNNNSTSAELAFMFPKFIKVKTNDMKPIHQLTKTAYNDENDLNYRNISIRLHTTTDSTSTWWEVKEKCGDPMYIDIIRKLPHGENCTSLVMYLFNDKIFPQSLSSVAAGG